MKRFEFINQFLNGWPFTVLLAVVLVLTAIPFSLVVDSPVNARLGGLCFSHDDLPTVADNVALGINLAVILITGVLLLFLNKTYTFINAITLIHASTFYLLEAANPYLSSSLHDGAVVCFVVMVTSFILFNSYHKSRPQRSIFLTFVILSMFSLLQSMFLYLIPVFFVGFVQMKDMSLKGALAMLLGLITPVWIFLGFGIITLSDFTWPAMRYMWDEVNSTQSVWMIVYVAASVILTIALVMVNIVRIYSYKAQMRAYNGFITILTVATMLMMAIDYGNVLNYMTILNCCLAVQVAHTFNMSATPYRFVVYLVFMVICMGMLALQFFSV